METFFSLKDRSSAWQGEDGRHGGQAKRGNAKQVGNHQTNFYHSVFTWLHYKSEVIFALLSSRKRQPSSESLDSEQKDLYLGFVTKRQLILICVTVGLVALLVAITAVVLTTKSESTFYFTLVHIQ